MLLHHSILSFLSIITIICAFAAPPNLTGPPSVTLDEATVYGITDGMTNSFLGIPYAQPPTGSRRLSPPEPVPMYTATINASTWGNQCFNALTLGTFALPSWTTAEMQQYMSVFNSLEPAPFNEDCLNLNVITPAKVTMGKKLPVVAYIFFSGFDFSGSSNVDGRVMVNRSIEIGEPVIWVSMNYRLGPYGFLPGKAVKDAKVGNLGLRDQRLALRWIQKYISAFGGDPSRVTLLGLSAGAASASLHTVANGGISEGLFSGVWAESGALQHLQWIDAPAGQAIYDDFASALNCSDAAYSLACLREVPSETFQSVVGTSGTGFWSLTADGDFLQDLPQQALVNGKVAPVPIVTGIAEDDGTIATVTFPDGANDTILAAYIKGSFPSISDSDLQELLDLYPDDPATGAPYGTKQEYQLAPGYKRIGSLAGDMGFDSNHRLLARHLCARQKVWSYYYRRNFIYGFGVTHGTEIPNMYGGGDMADMFIHFTNFGDPNGRHPSIYWPPYNTEEPLMLTFHGNDSLGYKADNYRAKQIDFINRLNLQP
ncbi:carotenoid ester lipase [Lentinus tigrinus ALCF2SS1-7]|uniref:Carboxylic ester hydrolase n=1 Tax=Lentinus tigrinus ALCF2SS1-6 TaxID=1328759 RepID=A0A5C2SD82_9APHY|nr:carotenoid ester lipase [Lentinus tigrinus ALCF2SS1-6]RPD75996.1 carotenoid ester lipase [Lentinus tigrinus ALCF2SS1-7]